MFTTVFHLQLCARTRLSVAYVVTSTNLAAVAKLQQWSLNMSLRCFRWPTKSVQHLNSVYSYCINAHQSYRARQIQKTVSSCNLGMFLPQFCRFCHCRREHACIYAHVAQNPSCEEAGKSLTECQRHNIQTESTRLSIHSVAQIKHSSRHRAKQAWNDLQTAGGLKTSTDPIASQTPALLCSAVPGPQMPLQKPMQSKTCTPQHPAHSPP